MHKMLKVPVRTSTLIGVGSSICGGSAIAATAPVIADDEEIAQAISVIFSVQCDCGRLFFQHWDPFWDFPTRALACLLAPPSMTHPP